jgi:hypothetical protein
MIKEIRIIIVIFVSVSQLVCAQNKKKLPITNPKNVKTIPLPKERDYTNLSMKVGASNSVIFLARNTKDNNNVLGYCAGLTYDVNNFVRVTSLYTHFKPINIEPTWLNINANTFELNLEVMAKFPNNKTLLYPFAGLSYNTFKGFFTGQLDYLNLKEYYQVNSEIKNNWLGLNLGIGIEHQFDLMGVFIDYRMRVGKQDKVINIMDVCYTGGIKIKLPHGKLVKTLTHINDRFYWF